MKKTAKRVLYNIIISILLIFTSLFASSCFFDPDVAVNIQDFVTKDVVVKTNSTVFYFYYNSEEHPIDEYSIINVGIDYYVDYSTPMKKKNFYVSVPDDVQYEEQTYFTVEIDDALTNESVVYVSVRANYKTEDNSRVWLYVLSVVIAIVMLVVFSSTYTTMCEAFYSNSTLPSLMWLGGLILYIVAALLIGSGWGTGPSGIIIGSAVVYFLYTLIPYFKYKL